MSKFHPKCRPPRGAIGEIDVELVVKDRPWRLGEDGRWRRDNGDPGLAFIGSLDVKGVENIVWVASCKCTDAKCPRWKAMTYAREKLFIESVIVHERPKAR